MSHDQTFPPQDLCFHKSTWEQNHRSPDIYSNSHYTNIYKGDIIQNIEQAENTGRGNSSFPKE